MNKFQILKAALTSGLQVAGTVYRGLSLITDWNHFTGLTVTHQINGTERTSLG